MRRRREGGRKERKRRRKERKEGEWEEVGGWVEEGKKYDWTSL